MTWNKKGIVLNFILSILIALIIFVPTILFASELFRVSDQGKESFRSFVKELRRFAEDDATQKTVLVILDEKTAVFLFDTKDSVFAYRKQDIDSEGVSASILIRNYNLSFPANKCAGVPCACLCQNINENNVIPAESFQEIKTGVTTFTANYYFACDQLSCEDLATLPLGSSWSIYRSENDPRRMTVLLEKRGEDIVVTKQ
ncbi:MAG: hypothetical protein Q8R37_00990 [Nanoarchaeota archaeon]|nr:hypothetical protein [Nanoarchaeota archaeon]